MRAGISAAKLPLLSVEQAAQLHQTAELLLRSLGREVLAIYLHGSATSSGLRRESDLDVLTVVSSSMTDDQRRTLLAGLLELSPPLPGLPEGPRRLEIVVVVSGPQGIESDSSQTDFVYGEWLRSDFERGSLSMPHCSADTILLLAQARENAVLLHGARASVLLPIIPPAVIRTALFDAVPEVLAALEGDERNVLLTLARMWWTTCHGSFASKDAAAAWAAPQLAKAERDVLELARSAYLGRAKDIWSRRKNAARRTAIHLVEQIARCSINPPPLVPHKSS